MTSTNPPTDQQLNDIEARATAATDGPWCTDSWEIYQGTEYEPGLSLWTGETCRGTGSLEQDRADAAFVAHARTDVPALLAEVRRLRAELAREERLHGETIDDRDQAQEIADKLAYAVAPIEVIGEHSSMNCPWTNAYELITPAADVDKLRAELAAARKPHTPRICECGHTVHTHTAPAPHSCFAYGQTCQCPAYRQMSHEDALAHQKRKQAEYAARPSA
ncbi:hypothetical protein [Streptomyces sp.]|uniref:hypothetical protein n=1 Tax=Streptomyces sp. TaxID=1931 RepID=UPI002F93C22E